MKKPKIVGLTMLLGLALTAVLASCGNGDTYSTKSIYCLDTNLKVSKLGEFNLLFKKGSEIPYLSLNDCVTFMDANRKDNVDGGNGKVQLNKDGSKYVVSNERGAKCSIDPKEQTLTYDEYDKFTTMVNGNENPLTIAPIKKKQKSLKQSASHYTSGHEVVADLKKYSKLDIYEHDNKAFLPLSVFNSLLVNTGNYVSLAYNGKDLYVVMSNSLVKDTLGVSILTELGEKFHEGVETNTVSEELAEYNYQSICLDFDYNYGLKEKFTSFDQHMTKYGYNKDILSNNAKTIDNNIFLGLSWLGDGHTAIASTSYLYDAGSQAFESDKANPVAKNLEEQEKAFYKAKKDSGIKDGIEYLNDTAFVTFTNFTAISDEYLYNNETKEKDLTETLLDANTACLFSKLYKDLTTTTYKNTIKNIVVDLSANDGGSADGLLYALSTLLGNVNLNMLNPLSGAQNKQTYQADMNLDGEIDENDKPLINDFNIYFLNSQYSFSSANAMPYLAKLNNSKVINLGAKTAGGPCAVRKFVTPIGTMITDSSLNTICKEVDGKLQNIDDGIKPDYALTEAQMIDRNYIVQNIKNWK